jgi:uncharacterized protein (TIRG00374 family)
MSKTQSANGKRWVWFVAWLTLTGLMVLLWRNIGWQQAWYTATQATPLWIVTALGTNFTILLVLAWQWVLMLPPTHRVAYPLMQRIMFIVVAIAHTGPPLAGHAAGIYLVATRGRTGYAAAVSAKAIDQLSEGVSKLAMLGAVLAWVPISTPLRTASFVVLLGVPLLFVGLVFMAHRANALDYWSDRLGGRLAALLHFLSSVARQMETIRHPMQLITVLVLGLIQKALEGLAIWAIVVALGMDIPGWGILLCLTAVNMSTMISITPANLGVYEGTAVLVYSLLGVDNETALSAAVLQHVAYLVPFIGCGWITLAAEALHARSRRETDG